MKKKRKIDRRLALMERSIELQTCLTAILYERLHHQLREKLKLALGREFREDLVKLAVVVTAPPLDQIGDAAAWKCQIATAARVQSGRLSEQNVISERELRRLFRRFLG